jgi:hypothetical protein
MTATGNLRPWRDLSAAPGVVEGTLAVLLSAVPVLVAANVLHDGDEHPGVAACLAVLGLTLPAAWSRSRPLGAAAVLAAAAVVNVALFGHFVRCGVALPAAFIAGFGAGARLGWPRAAAGLALIAADVVVEGYYDPQIGWSGLATVVPVLLAFFVLGGLLRSRNRAAQTLRARSARLRTQREETARLAVQADRTAVSATIDETLRERLGVIAETAAAGLRPAAGGTGPDGIAAGGIAAGDIDAGGQATDGPGADQGADPQAAREALAAIERDGRAALGQLREVVGALRHDGHDGHDGAAPAGPQPNLAQLPELLAGVPQARARLTVDGQPRPLPASLELSGYRIVEHLVQALADEPGAVIEVRLRYTTDALELHVRGTVAPGADLRAVLAAARQRVALHGGSMDSQLAGGTFRSTALLPLVSGYG